MRINTWPIYNNDRKMPSINKSTLLRGQSRHYSGRCKKYAVYASTVIIVLIYFYKNLSLLSYIETRNCQILTTSTPTQLSTLTTLNLKSCSLTGALPSTIRHATNLLQLDISDNPGLTSLTTSPDEFQSLHKLEILFSSSNTGLTQLPPVLGTMTSITRLGWRDGSLSGDLDSESIPPNLVHLILTNNNIDRLYGQTLFRRLKNVRKLMLSHNQITCFGSDGNTGWDGDGIGNDDNGYNDISQMVNLELLRLAGNKLTFLPPTLWTLPKLTWLTISGNPLTAIPTATTRNSPQIDITSLAEPPTVTNLGKGASGTVRTYLYEGKEVAVKILHGVTSDGRAEDELAIYSMVGGTGKDHNIVGCIGTLLDGSGGGGGHGEKEKGVVMERLPPGLRDLASPPTIVEVTQDRWDADSEGERFTPSFVMNALEDLVEAMVHLHGTVGVAHGDVYAHNMKVNRKTGHLFLLDFGASYVVGDYWMEAERLEVRAVGVLIGELSDRMIAVGGIFGVGDEESGASTVLSLQRLLVKLSDRCVDVDVRKRPSLREIQSNLSQLKYNHFEKGPLL